MTPRSRLFLIDANNQMYRAYHAIRGLSGPDGKSTNAVYGFVTMLRKLLADHKPEYIAASFDLAGPTFRDQLATDYKANRTPMPDDLAEQIAWVHEACEAMGVPIFTAQGFEADDVIGTLAVRAAASGHEVAIVTGDKDFFQLVGGPIRVFNPRDEGAWFDPEGVKEKFGVAPEQVVDVLALMGDSIDNIKGVPGIGEKGARDLISTHGSLDALLERAADVPQRRYREALLANAEAARNSRELLRIRTDVPVEADVSTFEYRGPSRERCYDLFSRLGFRTLLMDYAPTADTVAKSYTLVTTEADLEALAASIRQAGRIGVHVVSDGASPLRARFIGVAVATAPRTAWYVPVSRRAGSLLDSGDGLELATVDGRPGSSARRRSGRQGRTRPEGGSADVRAARRHAGRHRLRHDDRQLPDRPDSVGPWPRRHRARASRLQGGHRRIAHRQGCQGDCAGGSAGRRRARLRGRACGPAVAAGTGPSGTPRRRGPHAGVGDARATADPRARRHRAGRRSHGRRGAGGAIGPRRERDGLRSAGRSSTWRASSSTSTRRSSSARSCSRSWSCRR